MGSFETTVNGLVEGAANEEQFTLTQGGDDVGSLVATQAEVTGHPSTIAAEAEEKEEAPPAPEPNFVDYISGGCELNVMVAIDFTGSNGDPRKPGTLHYMHRDDPDAKNDYEKAIHSIVRILSKYDKDQMYPVVGFGAKYDGEVNHCFQCGPDPEAHGVDGVLESYKATFKSGFIMSAPTVFTEVIEMAAQRAKEAEEKANENDKQAYTILLIISDGAVADVEATAEMLEQASEAPLSVVIVGLGDADFSSMEFLDDSGKAGTDIAQFVAFNEHSDCPTSLTGVTLREIPDQLVSHFKRREIAPLSPVELEEEEIVVDDEEEEEIDLSLDFADEGDIVVNFEEEIVLDGDW